MISFNIPNQHNLSYMVLYHIPLGQDVVVVSLNIMYRIQVCIGGKGCDSSLAAKPRVRYYHN